MLLQGLRRYGYIQKADSLALDILQLPIRFGFYEYFDSFDGRGYGSKNFSWTASLFIDTAYENYMKTRYARRTYVVKNMLFRDRILNKAGKPAEIAESNISQEMLKAIRQLKVKYYTPQGTVNYDGLSRSAEYEQYKRIAAILRDFNLELLKSKEEKLAFWINLYNTIVVDGIIASNVNTSVKEVFGFFSKMKYLIGSHRFSPDDIEHGILRANKRKPSLLWKQFGPFNPKRKFSLRHLDLRVHFALVCGSRSCAPIQYYTPEGIDDELETATINFVNSSETIVIPEEKRILMSMIFKWYRTDFGGISGVIEFIRKYILDEDKKNFLKTSKDNMKIDYLYYDWNLNR
jgi:hypothetical protein